MARLKCGAVFFLVLVCLLVAPVFADYLYEYYDTGEDAITSVYGVRWFGQTFTPSSSFYIMKISLKLVKAGSPGDLTVSIRNTLAGKPTGSDLTSGTLAEGSINATNPGSWHNITMTTYKLAKTTQYAIIVRAPSGNAANYVGWWCKSSATYGGGTYVYSFNSGATWTIDSSYDFMFRTYGEGYNFDFAGCFDENTGLMKPAATRAVNVTAHYVDSTLDETFEVDGAYEYTTLHEVQHFGFNISSTTTEYVVSQYGFNLFVYNQSATYNILFPTVETDTNYVVNCTFTWQSTYTISLKTTTGCRVTFGTIPDEPSNYLNYYVYRTISSSGEKNREYWIAGDEAYGATIHIFDGTFTTYTINFLDLAGLLDTYPFITAKRYVNGTSMTVEKRKVDESNTVLMNLINGKKYSLTIGQATSVYTFGDLQTTSTTTIQLTLRGVDFPKETLLTYKYIRIYSYRHFGSPSGNITVVYQDLLLMTTSVKLDLYYKNDTLVSTNTQYTDSFVYTFLTIANNTDYKISAIITHERYGAYEWRQYFPRSFSTAPWALGWMGNLTGITTSILLPIFLIVAVAGLFSQVNAEVGAIMACLVALLLTYMGWINIAAGSLVTAFFLAFAMAIVYAKRRVQTA
jgi:hypothetical protein